MTKIDNRYRSKRTTCVEVYMNKVVIKILQDSVLTQTGLGGLTIYPLVADFLECTVYSMSQTYESCFVADKV